MILLWSGQVLGLQRKLALNGQVPVDTVLPPLDATHAPGNTHA
jgi:hypothetical protein